MEPFYTLICEYNGGTYVSQFKAIDEYHAATIWVSEFSKTMPAGDQSGGVADAMRTKLDSDESLVRLDGLVNAWCETAVFKDELILLNVVKTSLD